MRDLASIFRPARAASFRRNYTKTLLQTAIFWGLFLLVLPALTAAVEQSAGLPQFGPRRILAPALFTSFGAIALISGYVMSRAGEGTPLPTDAPRRLVVVGPYRYVRNPMAIAGLVQGLATGLWLGSPWVVAYVFAGGFLWNAVIRPAEEADLQRRFGVDFDNYRKAVRCWQIRRNPYRPA